jgi:hypothetical protein
VSEEESCGGNSLFHYKDSETFAHDGEQYDIRYGSGRIIGKKSTDTVTMSSSDLVYAEGFPFLSVSSTASLTSDDTMSGIIGLGLPDPAQPENSGELLVDYLFKQGAIPRNQFAIHFNPDINSNASTITFGGLPEGTDASDMNCHRVSGSGHGWELKLSGMSYDGA